MNDKINELREKLSSKDDSVKHGIYVNGVLKEGDVKNGTEKHYYEGKNFLDMTYAAGGLERITEYHDNGNVKSNAYYNLGKDIDYGVQKMEFDENGQKTFEKSVDKDGNKLLRLFDKEGALTEFVNTDLTRKDVPLSEHKLNIRSERPTWANVDSNQSKQVESR